MCSICCDEFPSAEGAFCPDGHFMHRGCLDMQCNQSLERDPVAVTESEKARKGRSPRAGAGHNAGSASGCHPAQLNPAMAAGALGVALLGRWGWKAGCAVEDLGGRLHNANADRLGAIGLIALAFPRQPNATGWLAHAVSEMELSLIHI